MLKKIGFKLLGLLLIALCIDSWAWMLGAFTSAIPENASPLMRAWLAPGYQPVPAIFGSIAGIVGLLFVTGVLPGGRK